MESNKRRPRRSFTAEFKAEAVELIDKIGIKKASEELDITDSTLRAWRKKIQNPQAQPIEGQKSYSQLQKEIRKLNKENGYLKEINKVLKKSTAIFSRDHMGGLK